MPRADEALFPPESVIRRVMVKPIVGLGGLRSLLLQALHPRAAAAEAQIAGYKGDPFERLMTIVQYVWATTHGSRETAQAAGARLRAVHSRLKGRDPQTGEEFPVDAPDLLLWVHMAEVESYLHVATRSGAVSLSAAEKDCFYQEQRVRAELVGLRPAEVPGSVREVEDYFTGMRPQLRMTPEAREAASFIAFPRTEHAPGLSAAHPPWAATAAMAYALLPAWARQMYGFAGPAGTDTAVTVGVSLLQSVLDTVPAQVWHTVMSRLGSGYVKP